MKTKKEMAQEIERLESQLQYLRIEKSGFNKYVFVSDLKEEIKAEIESGQIEDEDGIQDYINSSIDNECIYYKTCFEIAMELNATYFTGFELGEAKNISQLAYFALYEYVSEEINMSDLIELIEAKQA